MAVTQGYYLYSEDENVKSLSTEMSHLIEKMDSPDSDIDADLGDDKEDPEED